jgi:hypothetical protein
VLGLFRSGVQVFRVCTLTLPEQTEVRADHPAWRAQAVNSKSYYRKYASLIDRMKKSMLENGVIAEVRETEHDERGGRAEGREDAVRHPGGECGSRAAPKEAGREGSDKSGAIRILGSDEFPPS